MVGATGFEPATTCTSTWRGIGTAVAGERRPAVGVQLAPSFFRNVARPRTAREDKAVARPKATSLRRHPADSNLPRPASGVGLSGESPKGPFPLEGENVPLPA